MDAKLVIIVIIIIFFGSFMVVLLGLNFILGQGTISGKVTIGPLCPIEPCPSRPDVYLSRQIVLKPSFGSPIYLNLTSDGTFQAEANAGEYTINLTNCVYLSCKRILPQTIIVKQNETTVVEISIDTGVR